MPDHRWPSPWRPTDAAFRWRAVLATTALCVLTLPGCDWQAPNTAPAKVARPAVTQAVDSGWASLSAVGSFINKNNTSFDRRNYGLTKLSELAREQAYPEVRETTDASGLVHLSVRSR